MAAAVAERVLSAVGVNQKEAFSKDFFEFVKNIGESKSKQEEDRIIAREAGSLKGRMNAPDVTSKKMREYLIRLLYCEMLGQEAEFGYIHAVNLCQHSSLIEKRVGYLTVALCMHENHDLMLLLVSSLQKDLKSSNYLEVCAALGAVCKLISAETIPAVLMNVTDLLGHSEESVRKKAVMALHSFWKRDPSSVSHLHDKFRRSLCDNSPSVMAASLCILEDLCKADPHAFKDLVPSFVSILKQIIDHRLHKDYDYHRIPAPWFQIKLLRVLAVLGKDDQRASEGMYEVLSEVIKRADTGTNAGYGTILNLDSILTVAAVVYEAIRTVTGIYASSALIESAAACISRFISGESHNLKYIGIKALTFIVAVNPKYAQPHQLIVIDCLEDPDETLRRKTLDLLFKMTNPYNVEVVVEKMLSFLRSSLDQLLRSELVNRITQLAERFAPNNSWFIQTMNNVFEIGGELVPSTVAHNLLRLIAEGTADNEEADTELRRYAVAAYLEMLDKPVLNDVVLEVISWVLGEYYYLADDTTPEHIMAKLVEVGDRPALNTSTRAMIISALEKIVAHNGACPPSVLDLVEKYSQSRSVDLQQRCMEFKALLERQQILDSVLPIDASCEDIEVDLSFLDPYVRSALAKPGFRDYIPRHQRGNLSLSAPVQVKATGSSLRFGAYERPQSQAEVVTNSPLSPAVQTDYSTYDNTASPDLGSYTQSAHQPTAAPSGMFALPGLKSRFGPSSKSSTQSQPETTRASTGAFPSGVTPAVNATNTPSPFSGTSVTTAAPKFGGIKPAEPQISEKERARLEAAAKFFNPQAGAQRAAPSSTISRPVVRPTTAPVTRAQPVLPGFSPEPTPAPQQPKPVDHMDRLIDLMGGDDIVSAPSAPSVSQGGLSNDLMSLLDVPLVPSGSTVPQSATPSGFGDLLMPSGPIQMTGPSLLDPLRLPTSIIQKIAHATRAHTTWQNLSEDAHVKLSFVKAHGAQDEVVVFQLTNKGSNQIKDFQLEMEPPATCLVEYSTEPQADIKSNRIHFPQLSARGSVYIVMKLKLRQEVYSVRISGRCVYLALGDTQLLQLALTLELPDLLRKFETTTQEFGSKWGEHSGEAKIRIAPTNVRSVQDAMQRLTTVGLHEIQYIGQEVISCAQLMNGSLVLAHTKFGGGAVDVIVRSRNKQFSEALIRLITQSMQ